MKIPVETRKERRAEEQPREQPKLDCAKDGEELPETEGERQLRQLPPHRRTRRARMDSASDAGAENESSGVRKEEARKCSMK